MLRYLLPLALALSACATAAADEACPPATPVVLTIRIDRTGNTTCSLPEGAACCPDGFDAVGETAAGEVICVGYL